MVYKVFYNLSSVVPDYELYIICKNVFNRYCLISLVVFLYLFISLVLDLSLQGHKLNQHISSPCLFFFTSTRGHAPPPHTFLQTLLLLWWMTFFSPKYSPSTPNGSCTSKHLKIFSDLNAFVPIILNNRQIFIFLSGPPSS